MYSLDYESIVERSVRRSGGPALVIGTLLGAALHFITAANVSYRLFAACGGVTTSGQSTIFGGIDFAPTNLAWIPAGLLFAVGDGGPAHPSPLGLPAALFLLAGSLAAGYLLAKVAAETLRRPRDYGRYGWQLWACLFAWLGWMLVPVKMTLTYWYTVAY